MAGKQGFAEALCIFPPIERHIINSEGGISLPANLQACAKNLLHPLNYPVSVLALPLYLLFPKTHVSPVRGASISLVRINLPSDFLAVQKNISEFLKTEKQLNSLHRVMLNPRYFSEYWKKISFE